MVIFQKMPSKNKMKIRGIFFGIVFDFLQKREKGR